MEYYLQRLALISHCVTTPSCCLVYFTICQLIWSVNSDSFYFSSSPLSQDVEEGRQFRLECRVTPEKDIIYRWELNGAVIHPDGERRILESNSNLVVLHADADMDQGTYQCQAYNKTSKFTGVSTKATVKVYFMSPQVSVKLKEPSSKNLIQYGSQVMLSCESHSQPPVVPQQVEWFHNGNSRWPKGIIKDSRTGDLIIPEFQLDHSGAYHCRVFHPAGQVNSKPPFALIVNPRNNSIITTLRDEDFLKEIPKGRPLRLECPNMADSESTTKPVVFWRFMGALGGVDKPIQQLGSVEQDGSALVISDFREKHMNLYSCESKVSHELDGDVIFTFFYQVELAVLFPMKLTHFSPKASASMVYAKPVDKTLMIRFYMDLTPFRDFLADQIPNPPPTIQWIDPHHNEIPTQKSGDTSSRIYSLYGRHLHIGRIQESDTGEYRIILSNKAGNVSLTFFIAATFDPEFQLPSTNDEVIAIDEDSPLSIDCGLKKASPAYTNTISWTRYGKDISTESHLFPTAIVSSQDQRLEIDSVSPRHNGTYVCHVKTIGFKPKSSNKKHLLVREKLRFEREISTKFLELKVQGRIPCVARGYGNITITWEKKEGEGKFVAIEAPNQVDDGQLIIQFVERKDAGVYVCRARSTHRAQSITMTVTVEVGEIPRITHISKNKTANEGEQVVLNCQATGDPIPRISWVFTSGSVASVPLIYDEGAGSGPSSQTGQSTKSPPANAEKPHSVLLLPNTKDSRRQVLSNGSLLIYPVRQNDEGSYLCVAANSHRMESRMGLHLQIFSAENPGPESNGSGLLRTIIIVVSCAVLYLVLIIALTTCCSLRVLRNRRKRSRLLAEKHENLRLLTYPPTPGTDNPTDLLLSTANKSTHTGQNGIGPSQNRDVSRTSGTMGTRSTMPPLPPPGSISSSSGLAGFSPSGDGSYTCDGPMMIRTTAPPPPTPIDSRSYLSGLSMPMQAPSLFSQSVQLSGASTGVGPYPQSPLPPLSSLERLAYPRSKLSLEGLLGRGEFGDVCLMRASHIVDGEKQSLVMVKTLALHESLHIYEFQRQMDMFMKLDHSCVTKVLGVCMESEPKILILEYCEWGDLKQFLRCVATQLEASGHHFNHSSQPKSLPPLPSVPQRLQMCQQIALGMEHIANMRCIHRDLAARNILLTQDMNVKISHLGLCRDVYARDYCVVRERHQPLRWMPPEAILQDQFSVKSDVWSFGILICELFNLAQQPYPHMTDTEVISAAKAHTLQPEAPTECPDSLRDVLLRCWRETPRDRPEFGELCVLLCDVGT